MTDSIFTLSNQLTILRMVFIPIFTVLLVYEFPGWALIVFATAAITDALDGLFARWLHQQTALGAYLDPIADKLLLTSGFILLSLKSIPLTNHIPLWLTITTISRDIFILVSALIIVLATHYRDFRPTLYGKLTTTLQLITIFLVLWFNYRAQRSTWIPVSVYATACVTVFSGFHYVYETRRRMNRAMAAHP